MSGPLHPFKPQLQSHTVTTSTCGTTLTLQAAENTSVNSSSFPPCFTERSIRRERTAVRWSQRLLSLRPLTTPLFTMHPSRFSKRFCCCCHCCLDEMCTVWGLWLELSCKTACLPFTHRACIKFLTNPNCSPSEKTYVGVIKHTQTWQ